MDYCSLFCGLLDKGFLFAFLIIGIYISSQIIKFENISIEGGFSIGGAVAAITLNSFWNPFASIFAGAICAGLTGLVTAFLYEKCKIHSIMSGIIVSTGLFSIVLKIATSNVSIHSDAISFFSYFQNSQYMYLSTIFLFFFVFIIIFLMRLFLKSKMGLLLYAVGCNRQFIITLGRNPIYYTFLGLFLSNFFAGMSHALFVHYLGYFSIWFSNGILITALAGMILSQLISLSFNYALILGGVLYQAILLLTINLHIHPDWNRLVTAILIVLVLLLKEKKVLGAQRL